jgi:hypothetical protein
MPYVREDGIIQLYGATEGVLWRRYEERIGFPPDATPQEKVDLYRAFYANWGKPREEVEENEPMPEEPPTPDIEEPANIIISNTVVDSTGTEDNVAPEIIISDSSPVAYFGEPINFQMLVTTQNPEIVFTLELDRSFQL